MNIKLFYKVFFGNANIKLAESTDRWPVMYRYRHANIRWTFVFINLVESSRPTQASAQYPRKHVQLIIFDHWLVSANQFQPMIDYEITTNSHH